ncbi:MAG: response regulator [Dehalococcoidia bacterium]
MPAMRILLAEDESMVARLISRVLGGNGDGVELVASCHEAIRRLQSEPFDLVLLDMHLRDGDGFRVVDALDSAPEPHPPVVLITGERFDDGDPRPARVAAVLTKPFDIQQLENAVGAFRPSA